MGDGDEAVLQPGQVHDRPLQALGRVEGGHRDGVAPHLAALGLERGHQPGHEPGGAGPGIEPQVVVRQLDHHVHVGPRLRSEVGPGVAVGLGRQRRQVGQAGGQRAA
jgi:hypothetical protein